MLIAFSGFQGSGKDTAASALIEKGFTKVAFADALRDLLLAIDPYIPVEHQIGSPPRLSEIIDAIGWDKAKRTIPEVRAIMQRTGTEAGRQVLGEHIWLHTLLNRFPDLFDNDTHYVVTDCRFDNEADFVLDNGGTVIWIDRPGLVSDGHASESTVVRDLASAIVSNSSSIDALKSTILEMVKEERGSKW